MAKQKRQNTDTDAPTRNAKGHFLPGYTPNPGGRPKAVVEVQKLAQEQTVDSIKALVRVRDDENAPLAAVVAAATALLDRGWGKPTQPVEHAGAGGGPIQHQTVEDARPPIDVFLAEFAAKQKALRDDTKH